VAFGVILQCRCKACFEILATRRAYRGADRAEEKLFPI
jgi:hypothetical protein